jgi:hypothetical protein
MFSNEAPRRPRSAKTPFYAVLASLLVAAVGIAGYFVWQLRPPSASGGLAQAPGAQPPGPVAQGNVASTPTPPQNPTPAEPQSPAPPVTQNTAPTALQSATPAEPQSPPPTVAQNPTPAAPQNPGPTGLAGVSSAPANAPETPISSASSANNASTNNAQTGSIAIPTPNAQVSIGNAPPALTQAARTPAPSSQLASAAATPATARVAAPPRPSVPRAPAGEPAATATVSATDAGTADAGKPAPRPLRIAKTPAPPAIDPNVTNGYQLLVAGRLDEARAAYQNALRADAFNRDALLGLGSIAHRQGRLQDAQGAYGRLARRARPWLPNRA